jgi:PAS domain S-box-containing protein
MEQFGRGGLNEHVEIDDLVDEIELDAEEIAWRKDFLDFDADDVANLRTFSELFRTRSAEAADRFYEHVLSYDESRAIVDRSPKNIDELKRTQKAYLQTLVTAEYDEAYFESRARVGKLHELLDMPMKLYLGQYDVYYEFVLELVADRLSDRLSTSLASAADAADSSGRDHEQLAIEGSRLEACLRENVEESLDELHSILKIINLDMQVAVDTYLQSRIRETELERDRFAALFENVPTPVVAARVDDGAISVQQVNHAFEELFGCTAAELSDSHFEQDHTPPSEDPRSIEDRGVVDSIRSSSESELSDAEVTLETEFGRRDFIRVSAPVQSPGLDDLEYVFYIDVTDQKQRQERIQVLARVLRHDIRNKLNSIKGYTDSLVDSLDGRDETMAESIEHAATDLFETSEKVHRVERSVAGDATPRPINIVALSEDVVESLQDRYPACEFSVSPEGGTWVRGTDALKLALEEVFENGAEHNDAPEPSVTVTTVESLDGQYVEVRVADNGPGIPPAEYELLTGEQERSQTNHTSGLGLWAVNWIVTQAGGSLEFAPNSPRGSIVRIRLPRSQPPAQSADTT